MPIKVTYQNPGLEYDENMVCEDFLNMGMLPLESLSALLCIYVSFGSLLKQTKQIPIFEGILQHSFQ